MVATSQPAVSAASNQNSANFVETVDEKQKKENYAEPFMATFNGRSGNLFILKLHRRKI
jgi:hypothetical protein